MARAPKADQVDEQPAPVPGTLTLDRSVFNGPLGRVHHDLTLHLEDGKTIEDYASLIEGKATELGVDVENLTVTSA